MIFIENFSDSDDSCVTILFLFHFKNGKKFKIILAEIELDSLFHINTKTSSIKLRSRDTNVYSFLKDGGWINSRPTHYSQQQSLVKSYGYYHVLNFR